MIDHLGTPSLDPATTTELQSVGGISDRTKFILVFATVVMHQPISQYYISMLDSTYQTQQRTIVFNVNLSESFFGKSNEFMIDL